MNSAKFLPVCFIFISTLIFNAASAQTVAVTPVANTANAGETAHSIWAPIREADITSKKRYWLDIDTKNDKNAALRYNGSGNALMDVIIRGIKDGKFVAYSGNDDRFTTQLSVTDFTNLLETTHLAVHATNAAGKEIVYYSGTSQFRPESVVKFRIKEDSMRVKNGTAGGTYASVRIIGISPVVELVDNKGNAYEQPLFWVYYPDALDYFIKTKANDGPMIWSDILEGQQFSGKIIKESKAK